MQKKLFHRWQDADDHITNYQLPVISLRTGWRNKRWTRSYDTNWYYMHDAGVDGEAVKSENLVQGHNRKDFWELACTYYQCRLALVKRK